MFLYFTFLLLYSEILSLKSSRQAGILVISLYNLHGDGVEHSDKTLLLGGISRREVLHLMEGMMLIASLTLNLDFDGKFGQSIYRI